MLSIDALKLIHTTLFQNSLTCPAPIDGRPDAGIQSFAGIVIRTGTRYGVHMVRSFRHRGLKILYDRGDGSRLAPEQLRRIEDVLGRLDVAAGPEDLGLPGYRLHRLRGDLAGYWSVSISGNWRIIFRISDGDVFDVDLVDYH